MVSSLHWRISVRALTLARSARLSEKECHPCEFLGDRGIGPAEAVGELLSELGTVGVAHDGRRHLRRPSHVVLLQEGKKFLDLLHAEAADIIPLVDIAR